MNEISIDPIPSQTIKTLVGNYRLRILIQQKRQGILVDVNVDDVDIVNAVIAQNENAIVCREYLGFKGNLFFIDTQGTSDPEYTGIGSRFILVYLDEAEYELVQK